jgi:branched-subunit amino acid transport protein
MVWLVVIGMGLVTYLERASCLLVFSRVSMSREMERVLRFVPPAVLSALVLPAFVYQGSSIAVPWENPRLLAGVVSAVVAWRTKNVALTLAAGMVALWALQATIYSGYSGLE